MVCCADTTIEAEMAQTHLDIDTALKAEQERLTSRKQELETELSEINSRLARITRYFTDEPQPSFRLSPASLRRGDRHPRGFVQQTVLKTITEHPQGLSRGDIDCSPQKASASSQYRTVSAPSWKQRRSSSHSAEEAGISPQQRRCRPRRISRAHEPRPPLT